jgi:hypothetical protein
MKRMKRHYKYWESVGLHPGVGYRFDFNFTCYEAKREIL